MPIHNNLLGEEIHVESSSREVADFINAFNLLSISLRNERDGLVQQVQVRTSQLADKVLELEKALSLVKRLQGIIPICGYCKKIRNDEQVWQQLEEYISENSGALLSHGICPDCYEKCQADFKAYISNHKPENVSPE
ncbi:MAG: hypothetical protein EG822_11930 [Deltaproteobacteria bacterium]|nr:hypothetical protein [Deltaproteobacteria bacterium]TLN01043.1 MAG: hypothetical protein FDZ73_17300 [bacterium]